MDEATGLTYMQQRYYDPESGRFLSVDPVTADGNTGGNFNRYWYANNNPYTNIDPDGRICDNPNANSACNGGVVAMPSAQELKPAGEAILDFTPVVGDAKGIAEAVQDPSVANIASAVVGLVPVVGDAAGKIIKNADDVVDAAGGVMRSSGDVVAPGGRDAAKGLFREADTAGQGNRTVVRDKSGGGRSVVGRTADGKPIRIRFKPDGTTRIQAADKKIIYPKEQK